MLARGLLKLLQQLRFEAFGVDWHFTGSNLLLRGAVVAKLADAEALLCAHGRTKDAAGNGAGEIQVTKAGGGIERRTGLVIGEVFETRLASSDGSSRPVAGSPGKPSASRSTDLRARSRTACARSGSLPASSRSPC